MTENGDLPSTITLPVPVVLGMLEHLQRQPTVQLYLALHAQLEQARLAAASAARRDDGQAPRTVEAAETT